MRPIINRWNIKTALFHPQLVLLFLGGRSPADLLKEHVSIHLRTCSKHKHDVLDAPLIEEAEQAVLSNANRCFKFQFLYLLCRGVNAKVVVETGVWLGFSSAFILGALKETGGFLHSIDLPEAPYRRDDGRLHIDKLWPGRTTGIAVPEELKSNWRLIIGDSREELPRLLRTLGQIDIFHHDSAHTYNHMTFEFGSAWQHLKDGGLLLVDDAGWNTAFRDFCVSHSAAFRILGATGIAVKT